jgi:hypothetical protein
MNYLASLSWLLLLLLLLFATGAGLTDLDFSLGGSSRGREAALSQDDGFHGPGSARLSAFERGRYARIYVDLDDPLPLEELGHLSMWVRPVEGDGRIYLELQLDGDGDGKCDTSKSYSDAKLQTSRMLQGDAGRWRELDAFDLSYNSSSKSDDSEFKGLSLDEYQEIFRGKKVVKFWIRLYNETKKATAYFDYLKIGSQVISFGPILPVILKSMHKMPLMECSKSIISFQEYKHIWHPKG